MCEMAYLSHALEAAQGKDCHHSKEAHGTPPVVGYQPSRGGVGGCQALESPCRDI